MSKNKNKILLIKFVVLTKSCMLLLSNLTKYNIYTSFGLDCHTGSGNICVLAQVRFWRAVLSKLQMKLDPFCVQCSDVQKKRA